MSYSPCRLLVVLLLGVSISAQIPGSVQPSDDSGGTLAGQNVKPTHKDAAIAKRDFVKKLRVDVLGNPNAEYGLGDMNSGVSNALACPICSPRFPSARVRPAVPAFGTKVTWSVAKGRVEVFAKAGGINAWRPDNVVIDAHRSTSFNDVWLLQSVSGARIALDRQKHLWLGAEAGYFQSVGANQRKWSAATFSLTYEFGR
jgi:hypothetical protein